MSGKPIASQAGTLLTALLLLCPASALRSQAVPTATRTGDAQVGIGFTLGKPDYVQDTVHGIAVYADFDFRPHLGIEAEFHQARTSASQQISERTIELGARYVRTFGPLAPYIKGMAGLGIFSYPDGLAELSYNMYAAGVGADLKFGEHLRLRGDYEFQKWTSFPNGGLTPQLVTIGVAYHFAGKPRYK